VNGEEEVTMDREGGMHKAEAPGTRVLVVFGGECQEAVGVQAGGGVTGGGSAAGGGAVGVIVCLGCV
jgi:hypothetical protein